jgi:hypothetical protein
MPPASTTPNFLPRLGALAAKILLPAALVSGVVLLVLRSGHHADVAPAPSKNPGELAVDFPGSWSEVPGKISRTWRSPRPGAGLLQLSVHPPLASGTDGPGAAKELDTLLNEMESEMAFGQRVEIAHSETKAGPLAFAKYRSPAHGVLGFWLLASDPMIFATYVDGGPGTAEKDIAEAHEAFRNARFEKSP